MNKTKDFSVDHLRLKRPCRHQVEMEFLSLDDQVPEDHKARMVVAFVDAMDSEVLYRGMKSFHSHQGRPNICPKLLLSLWLYASIDGVVSSRRLCELCENHAVYRWIAGGVSINRTTLCDFRVSSQSTFHALLTKCLAVMAKEGLLDDDTFSQDGTKVKASAGNNSYRREKTLQELEKEAADYLKRLIEEHQKDPKAHSNRKKAARERAARERLERIKKATKELKKRAEEALKSRKGEAENKRRAENARASTTDPEARRMKMGDGGFRIAYNVQVATGTNTRVIYGVNAINSQDTGEITPLMMQTNGRLHELGLPQAKHWLADSTYASYEEIELVGAVFPDCIFYAPPKESKREKAKKIRANDSKALKEWRNRIDDPAMVEMYKLRPSTAEFSNAQMKNKSLKEISVRGTYRATCFALLAAISNNIERCFDLRKKGVLACEQC